MFLVAPGLLAANDWLRKPLLHNTLTGKLSDFAGLLAFTIFCNAVFPRQRAGNACATAARRR